MKHLLTNFILSIFISFGLFLSLSINKSIASYCDAVDPYSYFFKQIELLSEWEQLRDLYMKYKECDDGAFAEGFSDRIEWLFRNKYFEFYKGEIYKDKEFYEFIKRHIGQTWPNGSEESLKLQIENNCPDGHETICNDLTEKIKIDLRDIKDNK